MELLPTQVAARLLLQLLTFSYWRELLVLLACVSDGGVWKSCVEILCRDVKYSQWSGDIAKVVLPGLKIMATANLACSDRSLGQNACFSTFLVFVFYFTLYT